MKRSPIARFWDNADFPIAVAHRGGDAAGVEKENSLKAFQSSYDLGYRWLETDTVATSDGVLLAIHGRGLQRDPNRQLPSRLKIQKMTYAEAQKKIKVGGEEALTLEKLLDKFPDSKVFIDPKTLKTAPLLAKFLINRPHDLDRICIGSFHGSNTNLIRRRVKRATGREIDCAAIGAFRGSLLILSAFLPFTKIFLEGYIMRTKTSAFYIPYDWITRKNGHKIVSSAHSLGVKVATYTPNDEGSIKAALSTGVDAVMSDNVRLLKRLIKTM
jgi:glycerophosphoryl diester phosphodiesterase